MRKFYLIILSVFMVWGISAQGLLLADDFDYPSGAQLRDHGWTPHSAGGTNPLRTGSAPLSMANTPYIGSGIGNCALIDNTGSDENKPFTSFVDSGSVYAAFLMKAGAAVTSGGTGFFFHLVTYSDPANPDFTSISTAFRARTFITSGSNPENFRLGLNFNSATAPTNVGVDVTSDLDTSKTYLVVVKYTFIPGPDNDEVSLFVFEDGDSIQTEPAIPTLGPYGGTAGDAAILQGVALRQYNSDQNIIVDGIRVRSDWNFVRTSGVGLAENAAMLPLEIYPNPMAGGTLFIKSDNPMPMNVTISNMAGTNIQSETIYDGRLQMSDLPAGVYFVTIRQGQNLATKKLIIR
jgi:hypothetical protein